MDSTTVKALMVIEALSASEDARGVTELSRQLGFSKSNTFRILSTLASQGFVSSQPESGRYALTPKVWELGVRVIDRLPVRRIAQSQLKMLFVQLNETVLLSVFDYPDVLYISKIEGDYPVRASAREGSRAPAWATAAGKSLLAYQPEEVVAQLVLDGHVPQDRIDVIRDELDEVRARGFALSSSGYRPGINSVSVPIWGANHAPVAAVSVSGPTERLSPDRMISISASIMNTATRISEGLGGSSATRY